MALSTEALVGIAGVVATVAIAVIGWARKSRRANGKTHATDGAARARCDSASTIDFRLAVREENLMGKLIVVVFALAVAGCVSSRVPPDVQARMNAPIIGLSKSAVEATPDPDSEAGGFSVEGLDPFRSSKNKFGDGKCGTERWSVKVLEDNPPLKRRKSTVGGLAKLPPNCKPGESDRTGYPEFHVYTIDAVLDEVRPQGDEDYHLVVSSPGHPDSQMVVEIADPACPGASTSTYEPAMTCVREWFDEHQDVLVGKKLRFEGVGFYDRAHGQIGMAENCLELHPVLDIRCLNCDADVPSAKCHP